MKKERCHQKQQQQRQKNSIPATGVNILEPGKFYLKEKYKNQSCLNRTVCNLSQVKYYNYQKIGHYSTKCPKPLRN